MRITVGGILLVAGIAAVAIVGPLGNSGEMLQQAIDGVGSLVKSVTGPSEVPVATPAEEQNATEAAPAEATALTTSSATAASAAPIPSPVSDVVPAAAAPKPSESPVVEKATPAKSSAKKRRRTRRTKAKISKSVKVSPAPAVTEKTAAKPAAAASSKEGAGSDPLAGRYVALKLKSGREVKGVLLNKTAENVTLEIPGMGPFQYPMSNIDGIAAAE